MSHFLNQNPEQHSGFFVGHFFSAELFTKFVPSNNSTMLQATIFQDFISISVTSQVYDIASEIFPNREIQSGYDMRDFLTKVLPDHLLNQVKMDPESGAFWATFILNTPGKIEEVDIRNVKLWMNAVQGEISLRYISTVQDRLGKITPKVDYASNQFVYIKCVDS